MTRKELFNKILDQEFTEQFINNDINKSSFIKFRDNLLKFLLEKLDLDIIDVPNIIYDILYWLENEGVIDLNKLIKFRAQVTSGAMIATKLYNSKEFRDLQ